MVPDDHTWKGILSNSEDPFQESKRGESSRGLFAPLPLRPKTRPAESELESTIGDQREDISRHSSLEALVSPAEGGEQRETELDEAEFGGQEDKPVLEEHPFPVSQGKKPVPRALSASNVSRRSAASTESDTRDRKELDTDIPASTEQVENNVAKSYTTALTSKPRIPTSREVLARRTSEEEAAMRKINEEAMRGPMADMYFGRRPKIPDDFRLPDREETARLEAEQAVRLRARHAQRQADQREKDRHQKVTISGTLDTNPVTFRSDSTGSNSPVLNPNTAHEPEDSRSTGLKRKAEAASMYMADTSKKRRPDSDHPQP